MTRHGSIAEQLSALRRFVTEPDHQPQPIETNWSVVPANDNDPEDVADLKHDRKRLVTPSVSEIMRSVRSGDIEYGSYTDESGKAHKIIIRIGKLRFSDGKQTERAYKLKIDGGVELYRARMPIGALMGTRDQVDVALGGEENPQDVTLSNWYFADMLETDPPKYRTAGKRKKRTVFFTHEEAKSELARAYANTDMRKVTVTKCPDALPCGAASVAESFLGMRKTTCAGGGSVMWQDIVTAMVCRKEWYDAVDALKAKDRSVLEAARTAETYTDVGMAAGQSRQYADKRSGGRRALLAANDNLMAAIRKIAA